MDPLRYNCSQLWASIIYRDTVGFQNNSPFSIFLAPFRFPTESNYSLKTEFQKRKNYLRWYSQLLHRIRGRSLEVLKESDDQRGCVSQEDQQHESR
jgi:hypothetical protein